jgi:hypothetical protein
LNHKLAYILEGKNPVHDACVSGYDAYFTLLQLEKYILEVCKQKNSRSS